MTLFKTTIGIFGIALMTMAGLLLTERHRPTEAAWLAFFAGENDYERSLYRMRPDGSSVQFITHNQSYLWLVASAPDGRRIAFFAEDIMIGELELYSVQADGSHLNMISDDVRWQYRSQSPLAWSPDSEWIAYWTWQNGGLILNRIRPDGSDQQQITDNELIWNDLVWSSDGQSLLVSKALENGTVELFRVSADGAVVEQITNNDVDESLMVWSPDGEWVVFHAITTDGWGIFRIHADGSDEEQILGSRLVTYFGNLSWSPNGKWLTFTTYPADDTCIQHKMRPDGTGLETISELCANPQWSADGDWLFYRSYQDGNYGIFRLNINNGAVERLSPQTAYIQAFSSSAIIDLAFAGEKLWLIGIVMLVAGGYGHNLRLRLLP